MRTNAWIIIALLSFSVCCQAKEEDSPTGHVVTAGNPARLLLQNDTIIRGPILGETADGTVSLIDVQDVIRDKDGNVLVTGGFSGTVFFGDSACQSKGLCDCFTARFSPAGLLSLLRIRGTRGNELGHGITIGPSGFIYVVGALDDSMFLSYHFPKPYQGRTGTDGFLMCYDPSSLYSWCKVIVSGPGMQDAFAVTTDEWGNVYVTGTFNDTALIGSMKCVSAGKGDLFMLKLTSAGDYVVTQTSGTPWGYERGVRIAIGYGGIVAIDMDYNTEDSELYAERFYDYGMRKDYDPGICNGCIDQAFDALQERSLYDRTR